MALTAAQRATLAAFSTRDAARLQRESPLALEVDMGNVLAALVAETLAEDVGEGLPVVLATTTTAQPASPSEGDTYLLGVAGPYTGDTWGAYGHEFVRGEVATFANAVWTARTPAIGERFIFGALLVYVGADGLFYTLTGVQVA